LKICVDEDVAVSTKIFQCPAETQSETAPTSSIQRRFAAAFLTVFLATTFFVATFLAGAFFAAALAI
jgi:hypothetical protein